VLPEGTPRGVVTVTFMGQPLGQVKNIGNRANNLYPKEWRIKTTHIPTEYEAILRHS
jgi:NOL1/NOP2/fmu family ribosome biogenesis protein